MIYGRGTADKATVRRFSLATNLAPVNFGPVVRTAIAFASKDELLSTSVTFFRSFPPVSATATVGYAKAFWKSAASRMFRQQQFPSGTRQGDAGLREESLIVLQALEAEGPYTALPTQLDEPRNKITAQRQIWVLYPSRRIESGLHLDRVLKRMVRLA